MNFQLTNDFLHKCLLRMVLPVALQGRTIIRGTWTGEKIVCISFDCDTPEDMERIPTLLDQLRDENIPSTFALVGRLVNQYPMIVQEIIEKGHEILNHSFSHPENFKSIDANRMKTEISHFQELMIKEFDYRPKGFRAPHLMRKYNDSFFRILREAELYDTSYVGHGVSNIDNVIEVPLTSCPAHPQICFDYKHHFQLPFIRASRDRYFQRWELLLKEASLVNIFLDPHLVIKPFLERMIKPGKETSVFLQTEEVVRKYGSKARLARVQSDLETF